MDEKAPENTFGALVDTERGALKAAILINGAAAIAVLALLGNILTASPSDACLEHKLQGLGNSLLIFSLGVSLGAVAFLLSCISYYFYDGTHDKDASKRDEQFYAKSSAIFLLGNLVCLGLSVIMFVGGIITAYLAIT